MATPFRGADGRFIPRGSIPAGAGVKGDAPAPQPAKLPPIPKGVKLTGKARVTATVTIEELGWNELMGELAAIASEQPTAEVGFPANRGLDVPPTDERSSILDRADINEFGEARLRIPRRPFLRHTFDKEVGGWVKRLDRAAAAVPVPGAKPLSEEFARIAGDGVQAVKEAIRTWAIPPNAPKTIDRKGENDPLVESEGMMRAVQAAFYLVPGRGLPRSFTEAPKHARKRATTRSRGRGAKSILGALAASGRRWRGLGGDSAFRAPGKSASKKATRTRFVSKIKYRAPKV